MEKIVNYVKNGKGIGLLFILGAAVLVTLFITFAAKSVYKEVRPQIFLVAEDILPLTIKSGKIVSPYETYKKVNLTVDNQGKPFTLLPVVLDTRSKSVDFPKGKEGLYILKDAVYMVAPTQIRKFNYTVDGVFDKEMFAEFWDYLVQTVSGVMLVILVGVFFLVGLFKTWLAGLAGLLIQKFVGKKDGLDIAVLMRFCAIFVAGLEVVKWGLSFLGLQMTGMSSFIIVLFLELLFLINKNEAEV